MSTGRYPQIHVSRNYFSLKFYLHLYLICSAVWPVIGMGVVLAYVFVVCIVLLLSYPCVSAILVFRPHQTLKVEDCLISSVFDCLFHNAWL
jgi:nitrate reductase NapE component